jgi:hypothetical protein
MFRILKSENGSALLLALLVMVMLTFIYIGSITTTVTDMDISENQKEKTSAFYIAEGGLEWGMRALKDNADMVNNDSLMAVINGNTALGNGNFQVNVSGSIPYKTLTSGGSSQEGRGAVQVMVKRRRNPLNIWDNIIFAGSGQAGNAISGNVSLHGSVHILGEGEPFTDGNGNGVWDDADQYVDGNGNGQWDPGELLTVDTDGDGVWDPAEPYQDSNGNGQYDGTLTVWDLAFDVIGTSGMYNNYTNINAALSSRLPSIDTTTFNGEVVNTLDSELRVKHGKVALSGIATIGFPDESGGSPQIKETVDGCYVTDGWGGNQGTANVYSDNGTTEEYDLGDEMSFPVIDVPYTDPNTGIEYSTYLDYLSNNALVISGDLLLKPGVSVAEQSNAHGSISMDASGNLDIDGIVYVTGDILMEAGDGGDKHNPILFDGRGTLVSQGKTDISTHVLSKGQFCTDDVIGFISATDINIGCGSGDAELDIMGAFYAQYKITNKKQNQLAGAMVSNYFQIDNVPDLFHTPAIVENLPPGMPGGVTINIYTYRVVPGTWREL